MAIEQGFDSVDTLLLFCRDADNLKPWLPSELDRSIFSSGLSQGLHSVISAADFPAVTAMAQPQAVA